MHLGARGFAKCSSKTLTKLCDYMSLRTVYDGTRRKIVLGFDVGTTYSGISYRQVN